MCRMTMPRLCSRSGRRQRRQAAAAAASAALKLYYRRFARRRQAAVEVGGSVCERRANLALPIGGG